MKKKDCNDCKYEDTKSCRYPCRECHWIFLDKWEPKEKDRGGVRNEI